MGRVIRRTGRPSRDKRNNTTINTTATTIAEPRKATIPASGQVRWKPMSWGQKARLRTAADPKPTRGEKNRENIDN